MVQLDDVFTNSANGENETANIEVAVEIRKMQQIQLDQIFDLQNEISHLKAVKDMPTDLSQLLRRACANINKAKLSCIEGDDQTTPRVNNHEPQRQGSNRRGNARSKSRSKKPPSDNRRIDKTAKALGIEINSTLDRISELDAQNELLMLENQKLKDEMLEMQGQKKELGKQINGLEDRIRQQERLQDEADKTLAGVRDECLQKDDEIEKYAK